MRVVLALCAVLLAPGCLVRVHASDAADVHRAVHGARYVVSTPNAPAAIGPYSQGVVVGHTLYAAGQIGMDPATGALVAGGIQAETRQALENLRAVLAAAGFRMRDVVQAQVFLADLGDYAAMNEVYAEVFAEEPPARAAFEVAALPRGARVEILLVAVRRG